MRFEKDVVEKRDLDAVLGALRRTYQFVAASLSSDAHDREDFIQEGLLRVCLIATANDRVSYGYLYRSGVRRMIDVHRSRQVWRRYFVPLGDFLVSFNPEDDVLSRLEAVDKLALIEGRGHGEFLSVAKMIDSGESVKDALKAHGRSNDWWWSARQAVRQF